MCVRDRDINGSIVSRRERSGNRTIPRENERQRNAGKLDKTKNRSQQSRPTVGVGGGHSYLSFIRDPYIRINGATELLGLAQGYFRDVSSRDVCMETRIWHIFSSLPNPR